MLEAWPCARWECERFNLDIVLAGVFMSGRVNILLPTYNGMAYLPALLKSLLSQSYPGILLSVRDDCSADGTLAHLSGWAAGQTNVSLAHGEKLGAMASFFHLLQAAERGADFFAFCDQDDVWLPEKVERAVAALREYGPDESVMYCSRIEYVDENLQHLGYSRIPKSPSFANALVENVATGCTMVLNRKARDLVCERLPRNAPPHDWWCYLVVSAFGRVIYDPRPSIKYRQHANNLTGGTASSWELFGRRRARFAKQRKGVRLLSDLAVEFNRCFGDRLNARDKKTLERFLSVRGSFWERVSYNAAMDVWRQSWVDTLLLRALILMGRA